MINLYYGPVVNPKTLRNYDALPRCLIAVGFDGNIIWIENDVDSSALANTIALRGLKDDEYEFIDLTGKTCEFIMPGFVDTHVHACQFPLLGLGGDQQLLDWLSEYVFPAEARFGDPKYAEPAYHKVVERSIACGTTTSCYYSSLHLNTSVTLAKIVREKGQRAFVGKCNMDWNCPGYYIDKTPEESLKETCILIKQIQALPLSHANEPLVHPIITPRFALSCTDTLLCELGKLAKCMPNVAIQTHVSENRREVEDTIRRFGTTSYTEVYDRFGLLRNNTILGHGVWLTEKEMKLIAARGAGVAHCPASNFYLSSGMARVGLMLDYGVKVGLGTDVSGSNNPSILYTIQMASTASKMVAVQAEVDEERRQRRRARRCCRHYKRCKRTRDCCDDSDVDSDSEEEEEEETVSYHRHCGHDQHHYHVHQHHPGHVPNCPTVPTTDKPFANRKLDTTTLFYLATLGGAHVLSLPSRIGSFEVGKAFDALHVSLDDACGNPAVWGGMGDERERERTKENIRRWLERFLFTGDDRNVRRVWVQGALVGGVDKTIRKQNGQSEAASLGDESDAWVTEGWKIDSDDAHVCTTNRIV